MVSLCAGFSPLFLCLRASRSLLAPPFENCDQGCGQAGRWSFFLSSNRPPAVHNGQGSLFFCFSIIPALVFMTRGKLLRSRSLRSRPLSTGEERLS